MDEFNQGAGVSWLVGDEQGGGRMRWNMGGQLGGHIRSSGRKQFSTETRAGLRSSKGKDCEHR